MLGLTSCDDMKTRLLTPLIVVTALVAAAPAPASNGPVPGTGPNGPVPGPCLDHRTLNGTTYDYVVCGVPDIDQVRVTANGFVGLPGNGHNYCAPTSTTNWFAYLGIRGFVNTPAVKDWTLPGNFSEASKNVNDLGDLMGTTAASGTGGGGMLDGITQWLLLHGTPNVKLSAPNASTLYIVTKSFTTGNYYSPDTGAMVQDALNGGLVVAVVGFYAPSMDPSNVTHLRRVGGHLVTLVSAQGTLGTTASTLGVHDPATNWVDDAIQTPYHTDTWVLSAAQPDTYFYTDASNNLVPYTATLPSVNGSSSTRFDGYVTIEPKTVETFAHLRLIFYTPKLGGLQPPGPVKQLDRTRVYREVVAPGAVTDLALAPEGSEHPFLVKGSSKVLVANPLNGAVKTFASGPAGASQLTFGGPEQTLFVAGAKQLVGLDRAGHKVAQAALKAPLDALGFDAKRGRLVGISSATGSVRFFDTHLQSLGAARFTPSALAGKGHLTLAIASDGRLSLRRDGSTKVVSALPAVQHASPVAKLPLLTRTLAVPALAKGLAVDDAGHMFVSVRGKLVELLPNGKRAKRSPYNDIPAGAAIDIARSFSNADPKIKQQLDYLPADRQGPARPDLVFVPTQGNRFTVRNAGFDAAGPFTVRVNSASGAPETFTFPGLAEGATVSGTYSCFARERVITVDSANQVAESDETNNVSMTNACPASSG
jgi:hypothetical protein